MSATALNVVESPSAAESLGLQITELCGHIHAATYQLLIMIAEFDRKLTETGEHLGRALDKLRERDEQIQRLLSIPVLGHLLRLAKWVYARR